VGLTGFETSSTSKTDTGAEVGAGVKPTGFETSWLQTLKIRWGVHTAKCGEDLGIGIQLPEGNPVEERLQRRSRRERFDHGKSWSWIEAGERMADAIGTFEDGRRIGSIGTNRGQFLDYGQKRIEVMRSNVWHVGAQEEGERFWTTLERNPESFKRA